ncbi:MAG: tetratricopeptide repeat protein [Gemmatimonadetes bacterium]|nr:tetratricopeptide repeat protein [Gemmatimonadota bacterium]
MKWYTTRDVANLLGLSEHQVRAYARSGFLTPGRGPRGEFRFSFQDLVLLRTAKGLVAARIPARRIRRTLKKLREQLPRGRSLSELRIAAEGERVVVRDGGAIWNPESGQFHLDFTVSELAAQVAPLAVRAAEAVRRAEPDLDADGWYELGYELEACAPAEAAGAYARALELNPRHADALVNLGRLCQEAGRLAEAEAHYRRALSADAGHVVAWYDLGTVLEDRGRAPDAMDAYRRALAADAGFADAHFNLSRLLEQQGDRLAALRHLKTYKALVEAG